MSKQKVLVHKHTTRLPESLRSRLNQMAGAWGLSESECVRRALEFVWRYQNDPLTKRFLNARL